jgi:hypothetical protein
MNYLGSSWIARRTFVGNRTRALLRQISIQLAWATTVTVLRNPSSFVQWPYCTHTTRPRSRWRLCGTPILRTYTYKGLSDRQCRPVDHAWLMAYPRAESLVLLLRKQNDMRENVSTWNRLSTVHDGVNELWFIVRSDAGVPTVDVSRSYFNSIKSTRDGAQNHLLRDGCQRNDVNV